MKALTLACALFLVAARAVAEAPPPVDAAARAEALIEEGVALRLAGRESDALERFRQANSVAPSPRAVGQMGLAAKSLRLFVEAEDHLKRALASDGDPWVEQNRGALSLALSIVAKQLATLEVRCATPGASLQVNGEPLPLGKPLRVLAGSVRVELSAPGHVPWRRDHVLTGGGRVELDAEPVAEPRSEPLAAPPVAPRPPPPAVDERADARTPLFWLSAGVGVVGFAAGSYFGLRAMSLAKDHDAVCPDARCPTARGVELDQDARRAATWSSVGFGVGAAGLIGAGALYLTRPAAPRAGGVKPGLGLAADGARASAELSF